MIHQVNHLCGYSDAYIRTITVQNTPAAGAAVNITNKKVIFKNCAPFISYITEINNNNQITLRILI